MSGKRKETLRKEREVLKAKTHGITTFRNRSGGSSTRNQQRLRFLRCRHRFVASEGGATAGQRTLCFHSANPLSAARQTQGPVSPRSMYLGYVMATRRRRQKQHRRSHEFLFLFSVLEVGKYRHAAKKQMPGLNPYPPLNSRRGLCG